jgi:hypothetical protein
MNPLTPVLYKAAAKSDGFLTGMLQNQGISADFNKRLSNSDAFKREIGPITGAVTLAAPTLSWFPSALSTGAKLIGRLVGHPGLERDPGSDYVRWFQKHLGNPGDSVGKNLLYLASSASDGRSPGTMGWGPAITGMAHQFNPWDKPEQPIQTEQTPTP